MSLVELMVAMVVGLMLIAGVIEIYVGSKQTYRTQDAISRLQENARFALNILTTNLRPAGFVGCAKMETTKISIIANPPMTSGFDSSKAVTGHESTGASSWLPALPVGLNPNAYTDVITVQHGADCGAQLVGNMNTVNANIQISDNNTCGLVPGEAMLISDCENADLFRATNVSSGSSKTTIAHSNSQNASNNLSKPYQEDARIYKFVSATFYISNNAQGIPALYARDNTANTSRELIEGVENMQILYGVGESGSQISYMKANAVETANQWDKVVAVRIQLLMRTIDNVSAATRNYSDFSSIAFDGGFARKEFATTVLLRNRSL